MTTSREIVFVDQNVSDLSSLLAGLRPDVEPIVLNASERATAQIAAALKGRDDVPAVHVIAHGSAGEVSFAAGALSLETLADHVAELAEIGRALGETGDLLLWSCNTAQGERGAEFVNELAHLAAANVAAASGRVGAQARGGRWELDARADMRAPLTAQGMAAYQGVMSTHLEAFNLTAITDDAGPDDFLTNDHTLILNGTLDYKGADGTHQTTSFELWLSGGEFAVPTLVGTFSFPEGFLPGDPSVTSTIDWSFDLSALGISAAQFLEDGTYTLSLVDPSPSGIGTLPVGAGGNAQFIIDSNLDTDPPTAEVAITEITDDTGTNGDFLTKDTELTVSGTHGLLGVGETIQVSNDGGTTWFNATTVGATTWSYDDPTVHGANFTYEARVVDAALNIGNSDTQAVTIDTVPPTATITLNVITTDNAVNGTEAGGNVAVTGTVGGDVQVGDTVTLTVNGNNYNGLVQGGGTFSIDVAGSDLAADGDLTVEASVTTTDAAGNSATANDTQTYTVDTTADEGGDLSVTINDGGDGFINDAEDGAVSYTVAGVDGDATETVTFTSSGGGTPVVVSGLGNGTFSVDLSGLNDGTVTATISASDGVGNSATGAGDTSVLDTVVTAAITLDDITADNLVSAAEAGGNVAVTGTVGGDVQDGDTVTLTVNGNDYTGAVSGGAFSIDVAGSDLVADGDHTVGASVTTTDAADNSTTATDTQEYQVDATADEGGDLSVTIDDGGDGFINDAEDGAVSYTVAGVDADATAEVTFTSSGGGGPVVVSGLVNGTFVVDLSGLDDGTVTAAISATDTLGNTADGSDDTSVLDTIVTAAITLDDITADNVVSAAEAGGNVAVTGTVGGDVQDGDTVTLTVNGNDYTGAVSGGAFSIDVAGGDLVADGDHTVGASVTTTDAADNSTTATDTQEYQVDATADEGGDLSVVINDGDGFINDAEDEAVSYTVAGVDGDATATVTFTSSGGGTAVVVSGLSNGAHTIDLSSLGNGTVTAAISASDGLNTADGSGDTSVLDTVIAAGITLDDVTTDNEIDFFEESGNVAVTGTVGGDVQDGDTVTLTVNGTDYTGAVSGGAFSIDVAGSDLVADLDQAVDASVTATDAAGNTETATDTQAYDVDTTPPGPSAVPLEDVIWVHDDRTVSTATTILGVLGATTNLATRGDFDGDGDDDIALYTDATHVTYWELQDGHFVQAHDLADASRTWSVVGSGDFDADGDDDILWHNENGLVVTWEMQDGAFLQHHHLPVDDHNADIDPTFGQPDTWEIQGTGDFDGDGDDDILWRHQDGLVATWEMQDGLYVVNHNLPAVPTNWEIAGAADVDRDGDADIVWRHEEGLVVVWEMEDGAYVVNHNLDSVPANLNFQGAADFDDDGDNDLLWRQDDGTVVTWTMENGAHVDTTSYGIIDNAWHIRTTGEFPLA